MAQYVYSMHRVGKIVPPNRHILKNISLSICDNVQVTGYTMIVQDITEPGVYSSGQPAQTNRDWRKNTVRLAKIGSLFDRVKALEKQV